MLPQGKTNRRFPPPPPPLSYIHRIQKPVKFLHMLKTLQHNWLTRLILKPVYGSISGVIMGNSKMPACPSHHVGQNSNWRRIFSSFGWPPSSLTPGGNWKSTGKTLQYMIAVKPTTFHWLIKCKPRGSRNREVTDLKSSRKTQNSPTTWTEKERQTVTWNDFYHNYGGNTRKLYPLEPCQLWC